MRFLIYTAGQFRCEYVGNVAGLIEKCKSFGERALVKYLDSRGKLQSMKVE